MAAISIPVKTDRINWKPSEATDGVLYSDSGRAGVRLFLLLAQPKVLREPIRENQNATGFQNQQPNRTPPRAGSRLDQVGNPEGQKGHYQNDGKTPMANMRAKRTDDEANAENKPEDGLDLVADDG
ncbi:MAG: hypothetical protein IT581_18920 [Verrucomicrobiales bacterium]|nr:hypothetical protein [Verrucomicrobiales bacterium]